VQSSRWTNRRATRHQVGTTRRIPGIRRRLLKANGPRRERPRLRRDGPERPAPALQRGNAGSHSCCSDERFPEGVCHGDLSERTTRQRGRFASDLCFRRGRKKSNAVCRSAIRASSLFGPGWGYPLARYFLFGTSSARRPRSVGARGIGQSDERDRSGTRRCVDRDRHGGGDTALRPGVEHRGIRVFGAGRQCACISQDGSGARRAGDGAVLDRDPALCRVEDTRIGQLARSVADAPRWRGDHTARCVAPRPHRRYRLRGGTGCVPDQATPAMF
jgi:hypothetical protein